MALSKMKTLLAVCCLFSAMPARAAFIGFPDTAFTTGAMIYGEITDPVILTIKGTATGTPISRDGAYLDFGSIAYTLPFLGGPTVSSASFGVDMIVGSGGPQFILFQEADLTITNDARLFWIQRPFSLRRGTITDLTIDFTLTLPDGLSFTPLPAVPELSTWAMLLIAFVSVAGVRACTVKHIP